MLACEDTEVARETERRLMWLDTSHWGKAAKTKMERHAGAVPGKVKLRILYFVFWTIRRC